MEKVILGNGSTLVVDSGRFVEEFKGTQVRTTDDGQISLNVSRFYAKPGKSEVADGYEVLTEYATIRVSKKQAKKFAKQILKAIGE
jgi:hypothetical protein